MKFVAITFICIFLEGALSVSWEEWWTYDGISGPSFWGLINPDWSLCTIGMRQSPIDIKPQSVLYDPRLTDLLIGEAKLNGRLSNTGHGIVFYSEVTSSNQLVNISRGPIQYNYPIHSMSLHFGMTDDFGSEHAIDGHHFVGEIFGYNGDLYDNFTVASNSPHGLVAVSVMIQSAQLSNVELRKITEAANNIKFGGQSIALGQISLQQLLPGTRGYMTYEGSITEPGCHETVTWVVLNKPIYITPQQLQFLRKLMQGDANDPRAPLGGNTRPVQQLNHRPVRSNVFVHSNNDSKCPTIEKNMQYKATNFKMMTNK